MIALVQRVTHASVTIDGRVTASIGAGMLALIGVENSDGPDQANELVQRMLSFRMFPDEAGRMNIDLAASRGQLLLVPQFTLAAQTSSGRRPGFSTAASPEKAEELFECFRLRASETFSELSAGTFGAAMQVESLNDGPTTFWLQTRRRSINLHS